MSCGDGTVVDGGGGQLDAVAEVGGEAADYQDGGGVEEDYVAGRAWVTGEDAI